MEGGGGAAPHLFARLPPPSLRRGVLREAVVPDDGRDAGGASWGAAGLPSLIFFRRQVVRVTLRGRLESAALQSAALLFSTGLRFCDRFAFVAKFS